MEARETGSREPGRTPSGGWRWPPGRWWTRDGSSLRRSLTSSCSGSGGSESSSPPSSSSDSSMSDCSLAASLCCCCCCSSLLRMLLMENAENDFPFSRSISVPGAQGFAWPKNVFIKCLFYCWLRFQYSDICCWNTSIQLNWTKNNKVAQYPWRGLLCKVLGGYYFEETPTLSSKLSVARHKINFMLQTFYRIK